MKTAIFILILFLSFVQTFAAEVELKFVKKQCFVGEKLYFNIKVTLKNQETEVDVSNVRRGVSFKISFLESSSTMSGLSCTNPPNYIQVLADGFLIQAPLSSNTSTDAFFCGTEFGLL